MAFLNNILDKTASWFLPLGPWGLFFYAFTEASINPFPVEVIFIPLALANVDNVFWLALIATLGSVLGALFGYYIGYVGKITILERFFSQHKIAKIHNMYNKYESWAVFVAGFTPIPFKLVTISGGVFYVNLKKFIFFSFLGRGLRFFTEAVFIWYLGKKVVDFLDKNFGFISVGVVVFLGLAFYLYKRTK